MSQEQINKLQATALINLSGFYHFGLVYSWFCERALTLPSCLVSCWSVVFGSRHRSSSGFVSGFKHSRSRFGLACGSVRSRVRSGRALLCPCAFVVFVLLSLVLSCSVWQAACVFHWLRAFMFVMFCVNTRLMSLLISCVFMSRFTHG